MEDWVQALSTGVVVAVFTAGLIVPAHRVLDWLRERTHRERVLALIHEEMFEMMKSMLDEQGALPSYSWLLEDDILPGPIPEPCRLPVLERYYEEVIPVLPRPLRGYLFEAYNCISSVRQHIREANTLLGRTKPLEAVNVSPLRFQIECVDSWYTATGDAVLKVYRHDLSKRRVPLFHVPRDFHRRVRYLFAWIKRQWRQA